MVTKRLQRSRLLIFSADEDTRFMLHDILQHGGLPTKQFGTVTELAEALARNIPDLVLFDVTSIPGGRPSLFMEMLRRYARCGFVVLLPEDDVELAKKVAEMGAYDFLTTPIDIDQVAIRMKVAISRHEEWVAAGLS